MKWIALVVSIATLAIVAVANAAPPGLPDLIIGPQFLPEVWHVNYDGTCAVDEGAIPPGDHTILTFYTLVANIGSGDLKLGHPDKNDPLDWAYEPCHGHWHYLRWAEYTLRDAAGNVVGVGHKQGFCVEDGGVWSPPASGPPRYTCKMQGLSPDYYDLYSIGVVGQWIVIDGVPAGTYYLTQEINYARQIVESDYTNDTTTVQVTIP